MSVQIPLPAGGVTRAPPRNHDPQEHLDQLRRDVLDTKVEVRAALDRLADKHGIAAREVNRAVHDCADDMLSDLVYERERDLVREIEDRDPI
jgi:hypothetical protein